MDRGKWDERDWETLVYTIRQGNCILMLGPGAAAEQDHPLTDVLAKELAEAISPQDLATWNIHPSNLVQVAQYYEIKKTKPLLQAKAEQFYLDRQDLTTELHTNLAALPFSLILTATPDYMLFNALRQTNKEPVVQSYNFKGGKSNFSFTGTVQKPLVFYLYGMIDEPESLVLSEDDFLDFVIAAIVKNPLPANILSQLRLPNKSLLFLGFDFREWSLRVLLRLLEIANKKNPSFALDQFTLESPEEFQRMIFFYRESEYNLHLCKIELPLFVKELRRRFAEDSARHEKRMSVGTQAATLTSPPQNAPTVFLCHSKQNREVAKYLQEELLQARFNAWFDEADLRGGDEWDRLIEKAIQKEIDYFVVLQSKVMTEKLESYFNKEIKLALERQKYFRPGIRFIIPVKIEECPFLEELEHLLTVDLSEKEQVKELISVLKRDQERRNRR